MRIFLIIGLIIIVGFVIWYLWGQFDLSGMFSGGLQSGDPVLDLGIIASIYSSFNDVKISADIAFIGEVGLTGEIRGVPHMDIRIKEMDAIQDVQRLRLEPGDTLVFLSDLRLSSSSKERIAKQLKEVFPDNRVIVLDSGARLAVVGKED